MKYGRAILPFESIYGLVNSRNGKIFYVGKTGKSKLSDRLLHHISLARNGSIKPVYIYMKRLADAGIEVEIKRIDWAFDQDREYLWVSHLLNSQPIFNLQLTHISGNYGAMANKEELLFIAANIDIN